MCYARVVSNDVSVRELRNHTADVLRRVEAGGRLRLTRWCWPTRGCVRTSATPCPTRLTSCEGLAGYVGVHRPRAVPSVDGRAAARRGGHAVAVFTQDSDFDELAVDVVRV
jgi:hypothetical protein